VSRKNWKSNDLLIKAFNELHLSIDHAYYGEIHSFEGANSLPVNRLYFNLDETGEIFWSESKKVLEKGSIAFIPYNIPLSYKFSGGRMVAFHFNLEIFPKADLFADQTECFIFSEPEVCKKIYDTMFRFSSLKELLAIQLEIISISSRYLNKDLNFFEKQVQLRTKHEKLLGLIDRHLDAELNVEKLANLMGTNRNQLSKSFNRDVGFPLKKYLSQQLVRKSSKLLLESNAVKTVAENLRFSDEFYFSRFFKKHTKMSPSAFKRLSGVSNISMS